MKLALMIGGLDAAPGSGYLTIPTGSYADSLPLAAELGFDGVEVLVGKPTAGEIDALGTALTRTGLALAAINSGRLYFDYGLALLAEDRDAEKAARDALRELVRVTAPLAAPINIGFFRGLPLSSESAAADRLVLIMQEIADEIAALDVELLLEPSNEKEFPFIYSTAEGLRLVKRIARPNVCLMLDTFHMSVQGEDLAASLAEAMPLLRHIHFLDRDRNPPSSASEAFDLPGVVTTLRRHNYQHFLSMPLVRNGDRQATKQIVAALRADGM
jgi:sugar phosphate isomerase/epimerase